VKDERRETEFKARVKGNVLSGKVPPLALGRRGGGGWGVGGDKGETVKNIHPWVVGKNHKGKRGKKKKGTVTVVWGVVGETHGDPRQVQDEEGTRSTQNRRRIKELETGPHWNEQREKGVNFR